MFFLPHHTPYIFRWNAILHHLCLILYLNSFDHDSSIRRSHHDDSLEEGSSSFPSYFSELKKEAITPPNSHHNNNNNNLNNHNNNNNNNNNENDGSPSILRLKTEPLANPSSPESTSIDVPQTQQSTNGVDECAGCGRLIQVSEILWRSQWIPIYINWHATENAEALSCSLRLLLLHFRYHRPFSF